MSGPYADFSGPGSIVAARLAIEDFGAQVLGKPIELLSGDHQNRPDIGGALARRWFDIDGVDMVTDMPNSSVALAVQGIASERRRISINTSAATPDLTGKACTPTGFHWVSDSYAFAHGTTQAVLNQGDKTFFYITVDYEGGYAQERESTPVVEQGEGQVLGRVRHPLNTADFSAYLLQAQASRARVVVLANAGTDTVNSIKQAAEFGLTQRGQRLMGLFVNITDIRALGLNAARGLVLTEAFYWNRNDECRAFAQRFQQHHRTVPTQYHAGIYSCTLHYLKAVQAAGTKDALAVAAKMREIPVDDVFARGGVVRPDGRMVHDMYLMEVKAPDESRGDWDVYKILATLPGDQAFRPIAQSACPAIRQAATR